MLRENSLLSLIISFHREKCKYKCLIGYYFVRITLIKNTLNILWIADDSLEQHDYLILKKWNYKIVKIDFHRWKMTYILRHSLNHLYKPFKCMAAGQTLTKLNSPPVTEFVLKPLKRIRPVLISNNIPNILFSWKKEPNFK